MTSGLIAPAELVGIPGLEGDELAWGWPHGVDAGAEPHCFTRVNARHPRSVLEELLRPALAAGPVLVAFSGGRDSSALLALATHVARHEGLPQPVPLTSRYGGDPDADERSWQELVVRHLRLDDWVVLNAREHSDALGSFACAVLEAVDHNLFPPAAGATAARAARARGATLVDGEPGDWVLGPHRMTYPHQLLRRRGRAGWRDWLSAVEALAPAAVRRVSLGRRRDDPAWLRPAVAARHRVAARGEAREQPLRWDRSVAGLRRWRFYGLGMRTVTAIARAHGATPLQPLGDPTFLAALCAWGGPWGLASRTAAMTLICGDLLPREVLARRSKATFNRQVFGPRTRAFAETWDGSGVDHDRVDAGRLRAEWLSPRPDSRSLGLLQDAWLSGRVRVGAPCP